MMYGGDADQERFNTEDTEESRRVHGEFSLRLKFQDPK
jgi:hypothetical protein